MDIKNIYSQRIVRAPHKLPSTASSLGSGHNISNFAKKPNTTGSDPGPTPRERMLGYDKRLREEQKIKKQVSIKKKTKKHRKKSKKIKRERDEQRYFYIQRNYKKRSKRDLDNPYRLQ